MNAYALGALAAIAFVVFVGPIVLLIAPFVAQIVDDRRRPKSHRLARLADYRNDRRAA